jgi:hypothetical protein
MSPDIPRLDQAGADPQPRVVQFRDAGTELHRRGFLAVVGTAAMTLGLTMLGWIPLARPAWADEGTEYPDCGRYHYGPHGPTCIGAPYSESYCGLDRWFRTGCYGDGKGGEDCYQPHAICRSGPEARNAWLWKSDGLTYRCADGEVHYNGAPNWEQLVCSATLSEASQDSTALS